MRINLGKKAPVNGGKNLTPIDRGRLLINRMVENAMIMRKDLLNKILDPRRDINSEAGYPDNLEVGELRVLYEREGHASRVVEFWPDESWSVKPEVTEDEDPENTTDFEEDWEALRKKHNVWNALHQLDVISGIGRFGVLLIGINDGLDLSQPVQGINDDGTATTPREGTEILFLRWFAEDFVTVDRIENRVENPRFGQAVSYDVRFVDQSADGSTQKEVTRKVHWTRIIHVLDNQESSLLYGCPRLTRVYNRVYDIRKVLGGSGEMFWKGGFPGYALETAPDIRQEDVDEASLKTTLSNYFNGLQRYMTVTGFQVKSLSPQVADPTSHVDINMKIIAFAMAVPWRKFIGSEQAQLASAQDERTWNRRVLGRNEDHVTPMIIDKFIDRCVKIGAIRPPAEENGWNVVWPSFDSLTDTEKAEKAERITNALAKYVMGNVDQVMPLAEYLRIVHDFEPQVVEAIVEAVEESQGDVDEAELERQRQLLEDAVPEGDDDE